MATNPTPEHNAHLIGRDVWLNDGHETYVGKVTSIWRGLATCVDDDCNVSHVPLWTCIISEEA